MRYDKEMLDKENTEINPIETKDELCKILEQYDFTYEIHENAEEEYLYIAVINPTCEHPLYIELEDCGEFILSYKEWHAHYFGEKQEYDNLKKDIADILENKKCTVNIYSADRWISSYLSIEMLDEKYDYKTDIKKLPKEFREEIRDKKGRIELVYWDMAKTFTIDIIE